MLCTFVAYFLNLLEAGCRLMFW